MNKRVIEYLQKELSTFELTSPSLVNKGMKPREKKKVYRTKAKDFTKYLLKSINKPIRLNAMANSNDFNSIFYLRTFSERKLKKYLYGNIDKINKVDTNAKFNLGSIVRVELLTGESVIMSLSDRIYEEELPGVNVNGLGFLASENLKPIKNMRYLRFRNDMVKLSAASKEEVTAFEAANSFYRLNREYGTFKPQDLLYNEEMDAYAFYNNKNNSAILDAILKGSIYLVGDKNSLNKIKEEYLVDMREHGV